MYSAELEIKDTTESITSASYLDLLLSIVRDGQLHITIYDKRDDYNFHITNWSFPSSNIPSSPAYGVFISQFIKYTRDCSMYECFILRARRLSSKLLKQGYLVERLKSSFRNFNGRYGDLIQQYEVSSHGCWMTFWPLTSYSDLPTYQTFHQFHDLETELELHRLTFTELRVVSMEHLQRMWHASRECLLFRKPCYVPLFGTCFCSNSWDQFFRTCHVFSRLFTLKTPRYFLDFAFNTFDEWSFIVWFTTMLSYDWDFSPQSYKHLNYSISLKEGKGGYK